jgi:diguanylate cyclase (GGDEF)-like protein
MNDPSASPDVARRSRALPLLALILAIGLLAVAVGAAAAEHGRQRSALSRQLSAEATEQAQHLENYFARARSLTAVTGNNPAFRAFYEEKGSRRAKILRGGRVIREANAGLAYLEELFPGSIGEACFIDRTGPENARAIRGRVQPVSELSPDETAAPFFKPTFALKPGQVYQARPYLSPDTSEWVVSNSTPVATRDGVIRSIVHFEVTMESFRREAASTSDRFDIAIVEANSGKVVADSRYPQPAGEGSRLGRPANRDFARVFSAAGRAFEKGTLDVDGRPSVFQRLDRAPHNANEWVVVASAGAAGDSWLDQLGLAELAMMAFSLLLLGFAVVSFRTSEAKLHAAAVTDSLTGLGNRRKLVADLESGLRAASTHRPLLLVLFDLDGFKSYNDSFGHGAGDALLVRLAAALAAAVDGSGDAYRMGGDEFCLLAPLPSDDALGVVEAASDALSEHGEGFSITASHGSVLLPMDAAEASEALRLADQRMYAHKGGGRASAGRQTTDVLLRVLSERHPDIGEHLDDVTGLCMAMADELALDDTVRSPLLQAASLHDIGKAAIPDAILTKPGPLDEHEWAFIRQHTVIGERICNAAPSLAAAAKLVRWSHERVDGTGYPDGLSGRDIPLAARIIAIADAFDAMTSSRPYRPEAMSVDEALAELHRVAGHQFDAGLVEAFTRVVTQTVASRSSS